MQKFHLALILLTLSSWVQAAEFYSVDDSQLDNYRKSSRMALMASDYNCTDALTGVEANSAIPYKIALEALAHSQTIKIKNSETVELYFSTSSEDLEDSSAIRVWMDTTKNDHKNIENFSVWVQNAEEVNTGDLANPFIQKNVETLSKFNCESRSP